jgi:hypothetical protein
MEVPLRIYALEKEGMVGDARLFGHKSVTYVLTRSLAAGSLADGLCHACATASWNIVPPGGLKGHERERKD